MPVGGAVAAASAPADAVSAAPAAEAKKGTIFFVHNSYFENSIVSITYFMHFYFCRRKKERRIGIRRRRHGLWII